MKKWIAMLLAFAMLLGGAGIAGVFLRPEEIPAELTPYTTSTGETSESEAPQSSEEPPEISEVSEVSEPDVPFEPISKKDSPDVMRAVMLTPGEDFYVADLDTGKGTVKVGSMICYDREFPESARILMLKGAEIILVPNACPMEINRISQLRGRAYENMLGIATVNYPAGQPDCNGHSTAFDGIAYRPQDPGSRDTLIVEADESEGIFIADFPIEEMREYRSREVHGNAYRRPSKYKRLISEEVDAPFVRKDARR